VLPANGAAHRRCQEDGSHISPAPLPTRPILFSAWRPPLSPPPCRLHRPLRFRVYVLQMPYQPLHHFASKSRPLMIPRCPARHAVCTITLCNALAVSASILCFIPTFTTPTLASASSHVRSPMRAIACPWLLCRGDVYTYASLCAVDDRYPYVMLVLLNVLR